MSGAARLPPDRRARGRPHRGRAVPQPPRPSRRGARRGPARAEGAAVAAPAGRARAGARPSTSKRPTAERRGRRAGAEVEQPVRERPRLRDRLGKTRAAFSGCAVRSPAGARSTTRPGTTSRRRCSSPTSACRRRQRILDDVRGAGGGGEGRPTPTSCSTLLQGRARRRCSSRADRALHATPRRAERLDVRRRERRRARPPPSASSPSARSATGQRVVLAAADTFRAAAAEQLGLWAERAGADLVRGQDGADPGSVVFDAMSRGAQPRAPTSCSSTPPAGCTPRST